MKIKVIGAGYVGIANALLFAPYHEVSLIDIDRNKLDAIGNKQCKYADELIQSNLLTADLKLEHVSNVSYLEADLVIIATPTDFNEDSHEFDSESVELSIKAILDSNSTAWIMIKSTIPVGFTDRMKEKFKYERILFSPEFLREGSALYDNLYPSRIILGDSQIKVGFIATIYLDASLKKDCPVLYMDSRHAESIKLFSNTYLALRIAFFNELDSYAETQALDTSVLIKGVGLDSRIGNYYNNPSFGYGGYCLPKDSKQLLSQYGSIPQNIISAVVNANHTRKSFILSHILEHKHQVIGVYRLSMKKKADNFRNSAIVDVLKMCEPYKLDIVIYEPHIEEDTFMGYPIINEIDSFKQKSEWIIANRWDEEIKDCKDKVYTRDCFENDL
jgi:UDPglucose 6-dehydrogenase